MAATLIGSEGGMLWLVAVLLVLTFGLSTALLVAARRVTTRTRGVAGQRTATGRRR